ncbi:translocation and assembly module TamB [Idiomarina fontislapidosi]|uniref:Translocation and assembly module TamB C-terminal domain-containing protein n=1 Tax=Idiomarina fontislapidosi TaxID=263723 RepID=A0A432XX51_9GAMM|nr:translocation/assembly module TamB domain-containing protein [Idiomarina fontislapidosi]PYE31995.1 translocation and assembly module TamB [Idiomarina fontislapidosi]RUO53204.1 hypothetical protein CWE25_08215 [Idiomarina fontislapidosi]
MTMYKRLAKAFLYGLIGLCAVILLPSLLILGTETGSQWVVSNASKRLPLELTFEKFEGTLLDEFTFSDLQFDMDAFSLHTRRLSIDWSPTKLFAGTAQINTVALTDAEAWVRAASPSEAQSTSQAQWPQIALPIDVMLSSVRIDDILLHLPNQQAQTFSLKTGLSLKGSGTLDIDQLAVSHNYATLELTARVGLNPSQSVNMDSNIGIRVPDWPQTNIKLTADGDANQLQGELITQASIASTTQFTINNLLDELNFDVATQIKQSKLVPLLDTLGLSGIEHADISGEITTQGNLNDISIAPDLQLSVNEQHGRVFGNLHYTGNRIELSPLSAALEGQVTTHLDVAGSINLASTPKFDLEVRSDEVAAEQIKGAAIEKLRVNVTGTLAQLYVKPEFSVLPANQSAINVSADVRLDDDIVTVSQLDIVQNENVLSGNARADLDNLKLVTQLEGAWQQEPIKLAADVSYKAPYLFIEKLNANWRNNTLTATGDLRPGSAVKLDLNARDLSDLPVPGLQLTGGFTAKGELTGSLDSPSLSVDLNSDRIGIGEQVINEVALAFAGDSSNQSTQLQLRYQDVAMEIATDTALSEQQVSARINTLSFAQPDVGRFELSEQSKLTYQFKDTTLDLSKLCLSKQQESICFEASMVGEKLHTSVGLTELPLALVEPFIPVNDMVLQGTLSGQFDSQIKTLDSIEISTASGRFGISNFRIEQNDDQIDFNKAELTINKRVNSESVNIVMDLASDEVGASVNADLALSPNLSQPNIKGRVNASLDDLSIVQTFTTQVAQLEGKLDAQLELSTQDGNLLITPNAQVKIANALISRTGTSISETVISVAGSPGSPNMELSGEGKVGNGTFNLDGSFDVSNFTGDVEFNGDRLVVMDSPRIRLMASPNLALSVSEDIIELTGKVLIPEANISPPDLSSTVTPSPDVTVIQRQQKRSQARTVKTNLSITLGDDVRVDAYGFNGRLEGGLNVTQAGQSVPTGSGTISVATGDYEIYGQKLSIDRGQFIFNGGPLSNPALNLRVTRSLSEVTDGPNSVGARVLGSLNRPELDLFSDPAMPDASVLSYLLFGRGPTSNSESQNLELQAALLVGGKTTGALTQSLKETFSLDEVAIDSETSDVNDTSLYIGKYLSPNLYIKYGIGLIESTSSFYLRYRFTDNLWFESSSSTESQGADIIYSIEK